MFDWLNIQQEYKIRVESITFHGTTMKNTNDLFLLLRDFSSLKKDGLKSKTNYVSSLHLLHVFWQLMDI